MKNGTPLKENKTMTKAFLQNMLNEAIVLNQRAHKARMAAIAEGDLEGAEERRSDVECFAELITIIEEVAEALGGRISEGGAVIYR